MSINMAKTEQEKVLRLMAEKYPTKEIVYEKIVYLKSQLMLPKGTEHFMSDLHGAYDSFFHILNNCSGVIKEKVLLFPRFHGFIITKLPRLRG